MIGVNPSWMPVIYSNNMSMITISFIRTMSNRINAVIISISTDNYSFPLRIYSNTSRITSVSHSGYATVRKNLKIEFSIPAI